MTPGGQSKCIGLIAEASVIDVMCRGGTCYNSQQNLAHAHARSPAKAS